jgi:pimeloyl-ACP methyl ester carboxylesterase
MISSRTADTEGVTLHCLTAGQGAPVIPTLAERFTVIAPDLPGIGDSSIPEDGQRANA